MTPETRIQIERQIRDLDARSAAAHSRSLEWMPAYTGDSRHYSVNRQEASAGYKDHAMALRFMLIDLDSKPICFTEYEISRLRTFAWNQNHQPEMYVLSAKLDLMVPDERRDEWRQFCQGWDHA